MNCPKCNCPNVSINTVSEVKEKKKRSLLYWLFIGLWLEPLMWLLFGFWKLLFELFRKKTVVKSKTVTYATCQNCGYRWKV